MSKERIIIKVEGGIITAVHTKENAEIIIIDHDDQSEEQVSVSGIYEPDSTGLTIEELFRNSKNPETYNKIKNFLN